MFGKIIYVMYMDKKRGCYMDKRNRQSRAKHRLTGSLAIPALVLALLSACVNIESGSAQTSGGQTDTTSISSTTSSSIATSTLAMCDPLAKVMLAESITHSKAGRYFFTPTRVTIHAGEFILFINKTDMEYTLVTTSGAKQSGTVIDRNEDQPVQFAQAGTYTLISRNARHRSSIQMTVTSATGTTCGMSAPNITITFLEKHSRKQPHLYLLAPGVVHLRAGQSIMLWNKTNLAFNFSCKPSTTLMGDHLLIDPNERQVVQFVKVGQYICTNAEAPAKKIIVFVQ